MMTRKDQPHERTWTCRHCESWDRTGCLAGQNDIFPHGTPQTCETFTREPGSDDTLLRSTHA